MKTAEVHSRYIDNSKLRRLSSRHEYLTENVPKRESKAKKGNGKRREGRESTMNFPLRDVIVTSRILVDFADCEILLKYKKESGTSRNQS